MEQKSDNTTQNAPQPPRQRRPRMKLPFDNRRQDFASWIYDNRVGLCITTIIYLSLSIVFVISKISTSSYKSPDTIYIDLSSVELLEQERDRLLEEIKRHNTHIDWNSIRNLSSNENALNENLQDEKGTKTAELNDAAEEVERQMQENREAYERGLNEADAISNSKPKGNGGNDKDAKDVKRKGNVTVSYSFSNPVRNKRYLVIPAYRCEGGGEVVVSAVLNQSGDVISASVISGGDACMQETAIRAARGSRFNIDNNAPTRQEGTITYIFIPQ